MLDDTWKHFVSHFHFKQNKSAGQNTETDRENRGIGKRYKGKTQNMKLLPEYRIEGETG